MNEQDEKTFDNWWQETSVIKNSWYETASDAWQAACVYKDKEFESKVEVLLFRLEEIENSDLIASNLKSMAKNAIKEFRRNK